MRPPPHRTPRFPDMPAGGVVIPEHHSLVRLPNGCWSVRSEAAGETFHPVVGPAGEAHQLYAQQLRLATRQAALPGGSPLVLWDVGLGAAANAIACLRALSACPGPVELVSFDYSLAPLAFAREHLGRLGYADGFEAAIDALLTRQATRFQHGQCPIHWRVLVGDFPAWLQRVDSQPPDCLDPVAAPHAILYDPFSPARNPAMWTLPLFEALRRRLDPARPCQLATYSRSTRIRVTLLLAGFFVGSGDPTGLKEETTVAANTPDLLARPLPPAWLDRVRRSTAAQPLLPPGAPTQPVPVWDRLRLHPQFTL